jgi:hypothetical protein
VRGATLIAARRASKSARAFVGLPQTHSDWLSPEGGPKYAEEPAIAVCFPVSLDTPQIVTIIGLVS